MPRFFHLSSFFFCFFCTLSALDASRLGHLPLIGEGKQIVSICPIPLLIAMVGQRTPHSTIQLIPIQPTRQGSFSRRFPKDAQKKIIEKKLKEKLSVNQRDQREKKISFSQITQIPAESQPPFLLSFFFFLFKTHPPSTLLVSGTFPS